MDWLCPKCRGAFAERRERCPTDGARLVWNFSGRVFARRFLIERLLGAGTSGGTVWSGVSIETQRPMAIKLVASTDVAEVRRFERGARISGMLQNAHIAAVNEHGREGEYNFLTMELLEGETLHRRFTRQRVASTAETVHIADQVLEALGYAHAHGIVHRDIKLSNLFLAPTAADPLFIKVLDFGIAKWVDNGAREGRDAAGHGLGDSDSDAGGLAEEDAPLDADELAVTQAQQILGTPEYMAPEQIVGGAADVRSDLYALGIVMYRLLAGVHPFPAKTRTEMYQAHLSGVLAPTLPGVSAALYAVVAKALAKRPADRWESAAAMRAALQKAMTAPPPMVALQGDHEVEAMVMEATPGPVIVLPALVKPSEPRRKPLAIGIGIVLLLGVGAGALALGGVFGGAPSEANAGAAPVAAPVEPAVSAPVSAPATSVAGVTGAADHAPDAQGAVLAAVPPSAPATIAPTPAVVAATTAPTVANAAPTVPVPTPPVPTPAPTPAKPAPPGPTVPAPAPVVASDPAKPTPPVKPTPPAKPAAPVVAVAPLKPTPTPPQPVTPPTPAVATVVLPVLPAPLVPVAAPDHPIDDDTPRVLPAGASPPRALGGLAVTTADYPRAALASRMEGTVIVKVIVHIDGHVELVKFLQSDPNFNDAVLGILKRLRYAPVMFEGRRIAVYQNLKFPFTLN